MSLLLRQTFLAFWLALTSVLILASPSVAEAPSGEPFQRTWARTDEPVRAGAVSRTWMWGPEAFTDALSEPYTDSPKGQRTVQYFDKSRMEITHPDADSNSIWYVTNGLLVMELVTGRLQLGDNQFEQRSPSQGNIAGDADDTSGPTYAALQQVLSVSLGLPDQPLIARIDRQGNVVDDPLLAERGIFAAHYVIETNHRVAEPFWAFMNATGPVYEDGGLVTAPLFQNPFFATGLPITEAYWATVKVGGELQDVLLQCFERRCLTYTPENPAGWQVEAGNVGRHYHIWRYDSPTSPPDPAVEPGPSPLANRLAQQVMTASDDAARMRALTEVLDHLHIGLYGPNGEMLLGGAERGPADFYLYDFELQMMAAALGREQTWGLADIAMSLTGMEMLPEGEALDPELVRQALLAAVAASRQSPAAHDSLLPLLIQQLALYQPDAVNLFTDAPLDRIRLDALGFFLLLADIAVSSAADDLPLPEINSQLAATSNGILIARESQGSGCDPAAHGFHGDAFKTSWGFGKTFSELIGLVPKAVGKATAILDGLHGSVLAFSVAVSELDQSLSTHYGHDTPGQEIRFRVQVVMRDQLPNLLVECGWVLGTEFPPAGPIQGVSVHWFWPDLGVHGELHCGGACVQTGESGLSIGATDKDGIATLVFQPRMEVLPGVGMNIEETGIVTGIALYQSKFTNLLGSYAQYLTPKSGATRWFVGSHRPRGFKVSIEVLRWAENEVSHYNLYWDLQVCGSDPYAASWQGNHRVDYVFDLPDDGHPAEISEFQNDDFHVTFSPGSPSEVLFEIGGVVWDRFTLEILPQAAPYPAPQMRVTKPYYSTDGQLAGYIVKVAPIDEDLSCPAP